MLELEVKATITYSDSRQSGGHPRCPALLLSHSLQLIQPLLSQANVFTAAAGDTERTEAILIPQ